MKTHRISLPLRVVRSISLPMLLLLALPSVVQAQFNYTTNNGTITITQGYCPDGAVIIPDSINGLPVTSTREAAFYSCTSLTSVTIPNSVTNIGGSPFSSCTSLTAIMVDTNNPAYSSVGGVLFNKDQATLIEYLGGKAGSYAVPDGVTSIGGEAFSNCTNLTSITIPNSVTNIGDHAFYGCTSLTSVTIPNSVTSLGEFAFIGCNSLTSVMVGNSVISIGNHTFQNCTSLSALTVDASNPVYSSVAGVMFNKNQTTLIQYPGGKAGSYAIPDSVTNIGAYAFNYCRSLSSITIPNSVTIIGGEGLLGWGGGGAFAYCTSLTSVTIPDSVISIGNEAFRDCTSLSGVYFQGNAPGVSGSDFDGDNIATAYYLPGTTGWDSGFGGRPTAQWVLPQPTILTTTPSFGVQTNGFGFVISWATNASVVVEASTSLTNPIWSPVSTNTLAGGSSYFSDPQWTKYPSRFYRIRSP